MAQNFVPKQNNWTSRWSQAITQLLADIDAAAELANEFSQDAYGPSGANAMADATVQNTLPAATAALVGEAVGMINGSGQVLSLIGQGTTGRAYLEMMRQ